MREDILRRTLDYVENNLKAAVTAEEIAAAAGYSMYHFSRMFSAAMGVPLSAYILGRRLKSALYEIAIGYRAVDVVLEYGFDTYAGFYKAFVREYGCSPKKYLAIYGVPAKRPGKTEVQAMSISRKQIKELLRNWDIPNLEIHDVAYMNGAKISSDVWQIGEDYFLRHRAGREAQLKNLAVAKAIHAQGLGSAMPVPTKEGGEYLDGEAITILTRRVKGTPYELLDIFGEKRLQYAEESGRAVARLHRALAALEGELTVDDTDIFEIVSKWALPNVQKQNEQWSLGLTDSFFGDYLEQFGELQAMLPRRIIHRDPNPGNILFDGDAVSGFIDFDLSERNIRLFDPCYCATGVLIGAETEDEFEKWIDIAGHILRGYDAEMPLTAEEKRSIFHVICSIQMICVAYFNGIDDPDFKHLTQINRKMLQFIAANRERLEMMF